MTVNRHGRILYCHHPATRKSLLWQPQCGFPSALGCVPVSLKSLLSLLPFLHGCWHEIGCDAWWTQHDVNNQNQPCLSVSGPERRGEKGNEAVQGFWGRLKCFYWNEISFPPPPHTHTHTPSPWINHHWCGWITSKEPRTVTGHLLFLCSSCIACSHALPLFSLLTVSNLPQWWFFFAYYLEPWI